MGGDHDARRRASPSPMTRLTAVAVGGPVCIRHPPRPRRGESPRAWRRSRRRRNALPSRRRRGRAAAAARGRLPAGATAAAIAGGIVDADFEAVDLGRRGTPPSRRAGSRRRASPASSPPAAPARTARPNGRGTAERPPRGTPSRARLRGYDVGDQAVGDAEVAGEGDQVVEMAVARSDQPQRRVGQLGERSHRDVESLARLDAPDAQQPAAPRPVVRRLRREVVAVDSGRDDLRPAEADRSGGHRCWRRRKSLTNATGDRGRQGRRLRSARPSAAPRAAGPSRAAVTRLPPRHRRAARS